VTATMLMERNPVASLASVGVFFRCRLALVKSRPGDFCRWLLYLLLVIAIISLDGKLFSRRTSLSALSHPPRLKWDILLLPSSDRQ
jgi:hypothetical protein